MKMTRSHTTRSSTEWVVNTTVVERSASWRRWAKQLRARDGVETGGRLVQEEDVRIGEHLDSDAGPLALPAAQLADPHVDLPAQADGVDDVRDCFVDLISTRRRRQPELRGVAEAPVGESDRHG